MHDTHPVMTPLSETEPLYRIRQMDFRYADGTQALSQINLDVAPGDRIALVGQNGSGKTTLIKQLCGLSAPSAGQVDYKGVRFSGAHLDRYRLEIGMLFQDPDDQLFGQTLIDDAAFGPRHQGLSREQALSTARQALQQVYLDDKVYKPPHHLSFGQKKRAALAGLLAMKPQVLLLDEPTTNLDPRQEQVFLDLLKSFSGTLVCVSHDLIFLYELCDRALVLKNGHISHDYGMDDLVSQRHELRSHGLDFSFRMVVSATSEEGAKIPVSIRDCSGSKAPDQPPSRPLVALTDYQFRYPDGTLALSRIHLNIMAGEKIALVGENGAGKTTLLSCLLGLQHGLGTYFFDGKKVGRRMQRVLWRQIGLVFQDSADQLFCPSVEEEVAFGLEQMGHSKKNLRQRVAQTLAMVQLDGFEKRVPLHMSGGERKRLALACVLAMEPKLLILDEPSAGLDPQGEELLLKILGDLDRTLLLVSHDMYIVKALTHSTLVMHQGHIIEELPTAAFVEDPRLGNLNGLAYAFRKRGSDTIRALQHEHEHNHPHRHLHSHRHHHGDVEHTHLHEHAHEHSHRYRHSHPGETQQHDHPQRRYHDHDHPDHSDHSDHNTDPHHHS